jgi:hypothetical protein
MENVHFSIERVDKREIMDTEYEIPVPYISPDGSITKEPNDKSSFAGALRQSIVSDILCAANVTKTVTEDGLYKVIGKPLQQNNFGKFSGASELRITKGIVIRKAVNRFYDAVKETLYVNHAKFCKQKSPIRIDAVRCILHDTLKTITSTFKVIIVQKFISLRKTV